MAKQVTAILVVHDESALAQRAREAIQTQSVSPDRLVVVDTSKAKLGNAISAAIADLPATEDHWLWLVHDDSAPKPNALAELLSAVDTSETIAQVGSMQLSMEHQRQISQLGLTLSPFGDLINPINGQRDQSQHDKVTDSFAVSTSGTLIRSDVYDTVGGFDDRAPAMSVDFDLSMRIRRHGFRVVTAPRAKVLREAQNHRDSRRAAINLHLVHDPLALALLYWLALPLLTLYRVFWRLAQKRPGYIWSELRAGFWGIFTLPKRLASRAKTGPLALRTLKPLRASWSTVSAHKRADLEAEESANSLAAFERGDHEAPEAARAKNFNQAYGWLWVAALMAISWKLFPVSTAIVGGSALPITSDWFELFARAGASWQPIGQGFFGPSDPFNWVLLTLGSVTFWSPNLALVTLVWLARSLAFITAWKALSLLSVKAWQRNLGAAIYALLPAFGEALNSAEYPAIVATIATPWLVYSIAKAGGIGRRGSARSDARTWSWIGLSGVLLAIIGAASPILALLALFGLAVVAFTKIRRFGYLFWIPLPLATIYLPLVVFQLFTVASPLAILAEPTLGVIKNSSAISSLIDPENPLVWSLAVVTIFAILALLVSRWVVSLVVAVFGVLTFGAISFTSAFSFPAALVSGQLGIGRTFSTGHSLAALLGLIVISLAVHFLASLNRSVAIKSTSVLLTLATLPVAYLGVTSTPVFKPSDGSVVPLLLQKQSEQGTGLQLLVMKSIDGELNAELAQLSGNTLEDSNLAYRFSGSLASDTKNYRQIAQIVGDLASGNGAAKSSAFKENQIGYVLVPKDPQNANLVAALESSTLLEGAGLTPYGDLWRVLGTSAEQTPAGDRNPWSITKVIQLAALLGFVLLAIPSRAKVRKARDTAIFIDQSESELDV